jgi:protease-4
MPLETDAVLDRRLLRRKLTFWRVASVLIAIVALATAGYFGARRLGLLPGLQHVARIEIRGVIAQNADTIRMIEALGRNANVRALVVTIDSPGGTVAGSEALHTAIRRVGTVKPAVAVIEGTAASGGYIAALATDHIVTRETSITGSIGVIAQFPNVARLLETWGVRVEAIRSAPLKASPSGIEPTSPEALAAMREIVTESYQWFQRMVKDRRGLSDDELRVVSDGRIFTGRRAQELKLVDRIGGETEARAWLATRGVPTTMTIRLYRPTRQNSLSMLTAMTASVADAAGLSDWAERLRASSVVTQIERSALDGLLAVWQPPTP